MHDISDAVVVYCSLCLCSCITCLSIGVLLLLLVPPLDYTMVNFVKPNLLGTQKEFYNRFINPITNGQCRDSRPEDVRLMKQRAHVLYELLQGCVDVSVAAGMTWGGMVALVSAAAITV